MTDSKDIGCKCAPASSPIANLSWMDQTYEFEVLTLGAGSESPIHSFVSKGLWLLRVSGSKPRASRLNGLSAATDEVWEVRNDR